MRAPGYSRFISTFWGCAASAVLFATPIAMGHDAQAPWMDSRLSPDERARLVVEQLTIDEKISLVHGSYGFRPPHRPEMPEPPPEARGGAGFIPGIPRLGIPPLQLQGAGMGVTGQLTSGESTVYPSALALMATWNEELAYDYGRTLGRELRDKGFNVHLGGGANVIREAMGGRNFEYGSEDPFQLGKMIATVLRATQDQRVIATVKHYVANYQDTNRHGMNSIIEERALHEIDLLPFEIAVREGGVGSVMCSYNKVNGVYACENEYLLNTVLKGQWGFKGWVMSDWGAARSTVESANAGLDQEFFRKRYFSEPLKQAVLKGDVPASRLDDMVHRILRTMFAVGVIDHPPEVKATDLETSFEIAQRIAEQGIVLLKNDGLLPLDARRLKSVAVIGAHADVGVMTGGGSSRVLPIGGNAYVPQPEPEDALQRMLTVIWAPSSPLKAIAAKAPRAKVVYESGEDHDAAAKLAARSDVAIVFVHQHRTETRDVPNLSLPDNQDALVERVAAANPRTIVVIESGGAALTPWSGKVAGIFAAWYPGQRGGEAIANLLFGDANPSAKLPITFPRTEQDLPRAQIPDYRPPKPNMTTADLAAAWPLDVNYFEGLAVGYRWFDSTNRTPEFPFGFGLSYTTFRIENLHVNANGCEVRVSFDVVNTGKRAGAEVAQVYLGFPRDAGEPGRRLAGWRRVKLEPGQRERVELTLDRLALSIWDVDEDAWRIPTGEYRAFVGSSSRDLPLEARFTIDDASR
ncbi:MAG TPA: beta-glucosidase [Steroidobacteraceae bacterium]|mgnify:CR=1 FL=1